MFGKSLRLAGLLFSLVGDVSLMLPNERFIQGLVSFLVAHLCYIVAFTFESGRALSTLDLIPSKIANLFSMLE